jgi:beta-glucosidase
MKYFIGTSLLALQLTTSPFSACWAAKSESVIAPLASKAHSQPPIASNSSGKQKMDIFVSELMAKMTPKEKIGQMNLLSVGADVTGPVLSEGMEEKIDNGQVGGLFNVYGPSAVRKLQQRVMEKSRLKIPMIFGYDVIHGHRTTFPIPLGLSSSWDLDLIQRTAVAAASEASADGLNWVFSPMVDITRDPRWGRVMEGAGEDTDLGSQIASAMVVGYQGKEKMFGTDNVLACVKHFALYGVAEAGRDYNTVDMSRQRMYNEYLAPYKAAVDANVGSVMTSFNEVDGIPASGNKWLLTDLLRKQWGFKG